MHEYSKATLFDLMSNTYARFKSVGFFSLTMIHKKCVLF